ncbi:hypothetical protein C0J52_19035 [Blattella germanica]|nr:hypothetical protein C0J52_19035 [Blattella germanica]
MPVCVPTADYEKSLLYGTAPAVMPSPDMFPSPSTGLQKGPAGENLIRLDALDTKHGRVNPIYSPNQGKTKGQQGKVFFPVGAGDPCENCLHCLTEMGIGIKYNSVVSVVPCTVFYKAIDDYEADEDMIAAVGLVESNSVNIVAAMLVSPLMSPIMAGTFGTVIADRKLQKIGIRSEIIGLFISLIFGFIFGLLVGTTEDPWGLGDWPTPEMKGRGLARSLWIGILWALPSGTGVALALLQGSAGPLIGVAISASLLPPAVNCVNYVPSELAIMGIISFCLTLVNICCIFITAVVVLKIKEVAAPYTSSADLRRFWEHDIRVARDTNRATIRGRHGRGNSVNQAMQELGSVPHEELEHTLEAALREAVDDDTFRKVNRCSYSANTADIPRALGFGSSHSNRGSTHGASPLSDPNMLDQVIQALLDFQTQQSSEPKQNTTLNRFRTLSRSLRHGSTRSNGRCSTRGMPAPTSDSGLPTILETNSLKKSGSTRPVSLSDKNLHTGAGGVRGLMQTLSNTQQRFTPSSDHSKDKSERISLTMNPE